MKSPLTKLRGLASLRNDSKNRKEKKKDERDQRRHPPAARVHEIFEATQYMLDMRSCYDSLVFAAAATANSAFEFSEAVEEMGGCLLETNALTEDEDSGRVVLMLGKVQFELQKLLDSYRSHIVQTISNPSESLLKELQIVEEMKQQCDDKREQYKFILAEHRSKGRSKHAKGKTSSSQQLQEAQEEYEEEANQFVFRMKSLRQGQSRSLLTQAARHHAAQLNFFRRGLRSLEAVEPHVKAAADREHIDYQFSGLENDETEEDYNSYDDESDDGELSFDYRTSNESQDVLSPSRKPMEVDQVEQVPALESTAQPIKVKVDKSSSELPGFSKRSSVESKSAPIFPENKFDSSEKLKELQYSSSKKFHTYVLPTPADAKMPVSTPISKVGAPTTQLWHSSPLNPYKFSKKSKEGELLSSTRFPKTHSAILKESNLNHSPIRMPPIPHLKPYTHSDTKKIKRHCFSGPIPSFSTTNFMPSVAHPCPVAGICSKTSPTVSPPSMKTPMISELHELPRPPINSEKPTRPMSLVGHSAPLLYRGQEISRTSKKPLVDKLLEEHTRNTELRKDVSSPPLTPISLVKATSNITSFKVSS